MTKPRRTRTRRQAKNAPGSLSGRVLFLQWCMILVAVLLGARLTYLQVFKHNYYADLAASQQDQNETLTANRGTIYMQDYETNSLVPVATSQRLGFVYVNPSEFEEPAQTIETLISVLELSFDAPEKKVEEPAQPALAEEGVQISDEPVIVGTELDALVPIEAEVEELIDLEVETTTQTARERFVERLSNVEDPYEPVAHGVVEEKLSALRALDLPGVYYAREHARLYPEAGIGGHVIGYVGKDNKNAPVGYYGVEGYFESLLAGEDGELETKTDPRGRSVTSAARDYTPAQEGADIVLTIDRTIQFVACDALNRAVLRHDAQGGAVVIMDPATGDILAMCGNPDFDPANYGDVEAINHLNNPATFGAYEPGSIFKPITMAAGIDLDTVGPSSTYEDTGEVSVPPFTIRNSDKKAHGIVTMTEVLEESLNTGMVYVVEQIGNSAFFDYVRLFGFGEKVGVQLDTERAGDVSSLEKPGDIFTMTASYGQGITTTPIQMVQAYSALANNGIMVKPRVVKEIRPENGMIQVNPTQEIRRTISAKTARLVSAMLVSVVENGHAGRAGVPGYYVAGKTGTAQVARDGSYVDGESIGSFVGYGPVHAPRFVMLTRIDVPANDDFSSQTAAPLFGEIAEFLFEYLNVPPERPEEL